jgi:hypothetical protein
MHYLLSHIFAAGLKQREIALKLPNTQSLAVDRYVYKHAILSVATTLIPRPADEPCHVACIHPNELPWSPQSRQAPFTVSPQKPVLVRDAYFVT